MKRPTIRNLIALACLLGLTFAAAGIGSASTRAGLGWYRSLQRPAWAPPNWLFGPVWTALYLTMAVAAFLIWRRRGAWSLPLGAYVIQLALNAAWPALFFGLHSPLAAFVEICVLWAAIVLTILLFWPVRRLAAVLLLPYLAWVSFAACLNFAFWRLNA